jgi:hypothetical protein
VGKKLVLFRFQNKDESTRGELASKASDLCPAVIFFIRAAALAFPPFSPKLTSKVAERAGDRSYFEHDNEKRGTSGAGGNGSGDGSFDVGVHL